MLKAWLRSEKINAGRRQRRTRQVTRRIENLTKGAEDEINFVEFQTSNAFLREAPLASLL